MLRGMRLPTDLVSHLVDTAVVRRMGSYNQNQVLCTSMWWLESVLLVCGCCGFAICTLICIRMLRATSWQAS